MNALQELIATHCHDTGDTLADIAARGELSRQTVSAIAHRDTPGAIPRRQTLIKLATGLGLSLDVVERAAAMAASQNSNGGMSELRLAVLLDQARSLDDQSLRVLTATARALQDTERGA